MIEYRPIGTAGYQCVLTSDSGRELHVRFDSAEGEPKADGDEPLVGNASLKALLLSYAAHEYQYRRLRAPEKRKSHREQADSDRHDARALLGLLEQRGRRTCRGWCSACLTRTSHRYVRGRGLTTVYLCENCGAPTSPCAVPGCRHQANRGLRRFSTPRYCAAHRHEIPSFRKLDRQLESLEDYRGWLKFERRNAARVTRIAGVAAASGVALAPFAFLAAPAIGGITGSLTGLSGAAATSHGLALWGGGSLAAGGLGMAGGTTVITALGGGLGSALGAAATSAYVSSDSSFRIEKLREGLGTPVLFATGFLTQNEDGWGSWKRLIDERYPDAPVYRVYWGAKELRDLTQLVAGGATRHAVRRSATTVARRASSRAAARLGPIGSFFLARDVAANPWTVARTRAEMTGAILADLLARTEESPFILMGHSLGGRVMLTAAQVLGSKQGEPRVESMHLLGAAVSSGKDWRSLDQAVSGTIWNYHSRNDAVLGNLYRVAQFGHRAVGQVGFGSSFPAIRDRDVSKTVRSHNAYVTKVKLARETSKKGARA
jgi:pimeloyl-ACP methyl ester carboxylesterase